MSVETLFRIISSSPESALLVRCARLDIDPPGAERIKELIGPNLNWTRLLSLAQRHALIPLLFCHLNNLASDRVPPECLKELRDRFQSNSALVVLLTGEMVRLLDLFERNHIPAVAYKGPAISVGIYGKLTLRQFADLDILVPETDVWKATELLIDQGYQAHFVIPARKQSTFIRLSYVRLFKRESDRTAVELHWRLAPRFFGAAFDTSRLWQRSRMIQLQGASVRVPLSEDLILMLCIHGAKDCWEKLEWVCGLGELIRFDTQVDWEELLERARGMHCLAIVSLGLLLAHDLVAAPIPADVLSMLSSRKQLDLIAGKIVTRFFNDEYAPFTLPQRINFHLQLKDSLRERFRYCSRLALTTTPVDWEVVSLPESVSFLYYPLRVLRLLKKYGRQSDQIAAKSRSVGPV